MFCFQSSLVSWFGWFLFWFWFWWGFFSISVYFYSFVFLNTEPPQFSCSSSWALTKSIKQERTCPWTNYSCNFRGCIQKLFRLAKWVILPLGRCGHLQSHNISIQHIHGWSHLSTTPGYHCFSIFPALSSVWISTAVITSVSQEFELSEILYI